jgi:anhydro-N-acetylmuramic acid kinase
MSHVRHIIGCMTGTSIDGIDAAVVRVRGRGASMHATLLCLASLPLGRCEGPLRRLASQEPMTAGEISRLMTDFAALHVDACREAWKDARDSHGAPPTPDLISAHGQTVFHQPPHSWQVLQPAPIAAAMGVPVVCDLRQADLAAGGQGAPLTPMADYVLFSRAASPVHVVNLGGFCNVTIVPPRAETDDEAAHIERASWIRGRDLCPCNHLLDEIARRGMGRPYDADGQEALSGRVDPGMRRELREVLAGMGHEGRSLGTGDELGSLVKSFLEIASPADAAATACAAIADVAAGAFPKEGPVLLLGGGARNGRLEREFRRAAGERRVEPPPMPAEAREAACWAVLGALAEDGVEVSLPAVTGRGSSRTPGHWTR